MISIVDRKWPLMTFSSKFSMLIKMRVFIRITLVFVCAFLIAVREIRCEDIGSPSSGEESGEDPSGKAEDQSEQRKDGKTGVLSGGGRRSTAQPSANATRDSQLLTLLAARRRQLLSGRLASHINTLATLVHKPHKTNTTFAQLEIRDLNSSTVKRVTFDNSSNEASPTLKLVSHDGTKEIRQDIKPHEVRTHLFIPKLYQDNKSRTGYINIRRKDSTNKTTPVIEITTENGVVYVPPESLEGLDKEVELDPEEEFQVDESNHGVYLLNYSDTENVTQSQDLNVTISQPVKENVTKLEIAISTANVTKDNTTVKEDDNKNENKTEANVIVNSTEIKTNEAHIQNDKDKENNTLFMSDEIYNHFRPLEPELPEEDMAPFHVFGKKLDVQAISDNLTNSPSLSASTKSVNFIVAPQEKRKFNSRYSATEKYRNTSVDEEEFNEDMDVSVVKNIIEKNKIRNSVKGPAPARHIGLVNAYRKHASTSTTSTTSKPLNISQLNVTEAIIQNVTPSTLDKAKDSNRTNNTNIGKDLPSKSNNTSSGKDNIVSKSNTTLIPRNYTRSYFNLRRRPSRVTASPSTENILPTFNFLNNTTTEKVSTSVYTAVVTSVSITSSMKGQNKTDGTIKEDNSTASEVPLDLGGNFTVPNAVPINSTELTPLSSAFISSTYKPYRHRIRIRTTTPENILKSGASSTPIIMFHKPTDSSIISDTTTKNTVDIKNEETSKISERLANLFRPHSNDDGMNISINGSTVRPKNMRRRRPTTTSTVASPMYVQTTTEKTTTTFLPITPKINLFTTTNKPDTTENTFMSYIVTSKTSSESSTQQLFLSTNTSSQTNKTLSNATNSETTSQNEEVVIEAEKTYTASYVLAGLGFLPVMAIIAFLLRNVLNKKTKDIDTEYEGYFDDGEVKKESPIIPVARPPIPTPSKLDQKWEFPRNKLRLQTLLGQGNFGQVWKAEADDLNGHDGLTRLVAVKSIKETASQKEKQELLHEIYIMQKIGTHPNVVTLLACCTEQEPYLLIMEYVMCGKLLTYLRERRSRPDRFSGSGALTSRDLTVFAYCVARGMDYIASKGIVHRDLAARNVLVDHNKLCKIADFGMSRATGGASRNRGALPVRWMAPEALLYNVYSHETDVWAFGILLWEIVTLGSTPYAAMSGREVLTAVTEGYRLKRPPHCKPQLYHAMHSCWHADPSQRPNFAALKSQLAELLDNEPSEGNYVDLDSFYQESSVYSDPSAIIHDDEGLSAEYDRERRCFRELTKGPGKYDNRAFSFRDEELRNKFGIGTPRMGGFGIRDVPFNERNFSDGEFNERTFDKNFAERNFTEKDFNDTNFTERKDGKLSTSSFHRERNERERENPLVSRNSFNGFPRIATRDNHFQMLQDSRNKRVSEFECDI